MYLTHRLGDWLFIVSVVPISILSATHASATHARTTPHSRVAAARGEEHSLAAVSALHDPLHPCLIYDLTASAIPRCWSCMAVAWCRRTFRWRSIIRFSFMTICGRELGEKKRPTRKTREPKIAKRGIKVRGARTGWSLPRTDVDDDDDDENTSIDGKLGVAFLVVA